VLAVDKRRMNLPAGNAQTTGAKRSFLLIAGSAALVLAVIGAILPVMPTTPFLLLSAYCYARSSKRCYAWLTTNRLFGKYVTYVAQGRRLSLPIKAALIASCWVTASISALLLAPNLTVKIFSLTIAGAMSAYIVLQGRRRAQPQSAGARFPRG
jgi:hypothetical protein